MKTLHLFILALFTGASLAIAEKPATATPQNMLLIITDQQTVDALSCAGNQHVKTPNLDRLAARGIRFEKSYCTYTEESAAVPLFVVPPGGKAGVDNQHLVSGLDVMPTLLDYAGIAAPASLQGKSLRPLVEGKEVPWREFVVSEVNGFGEARMVRTDRYKYIVFAKGENREQLFDMEKDPGELTNLIADPALGNEVERHRRLLKQWRKETQDETGNRPPVQKGRKGKNK